VIFGNYRFSNIFLNNGILPIYKGSTFRGGFGHALKNIICTSNELLCDQCMLAKQCVYVRLFEPQHLKINLPEVKQMSTLPSPFVIEPPYKYFGCVSDVFMIKDYSFTLMPMIPLHIQQP